MVFSTQVNPVLECDFMTDVNIPQIVMESHIAEEHAARLAPTLGMALESLTNFLGQFPEIAETFGVLPLKVELAYILKVPVANAYQIGYEVCRQEVTRLAESKE